MASKKGRCFSYAAAEACSLVLDPKMCPLSGSACAFPKRWLLAWNVPLTSLFGSQK